MASIGHGISNAVRNHIPIWVDDTLIDTLYQEYNKSGGTIAKDGYGGFRRRVKEPSDWVRKSRKNTDSGYERLYHCKTVAKASLIVHSPPGDLSANGYVFCIDGKPIAGGKTKLKSTHVTTAISKNDKTSVKAEELAFVKFSEEELRKMHTQMMFSDGFAYFEAERG